MKKHETQVYNRYWNYAPVFTDFENELFRGVVAACVEFVDTHITESFSPEKNIESWNFLQSRFPCPVKEEEDAWKTQRKRWNQLVKLGFIYPQFKGYTEECIDFLSSSNEMERKQALSKAVYKYGNLRNTVTTESTESDGQLGFLIRTIEHNKCLSLLELYTIMNYNFNYKTVSFITTEEIRAKSNNQILDEFNRKYTQTLHFANFLSKLLYLDCDNDCIYYKSDISYENIIS